MSQLVFGTKDNLEQELFNTDKLVFLVFFSFMDAESQKAIPVFEAFLKERAADIKVIAVDADEERQLVSYFTPETLPLTVVIKGADVLAVITGAPTREGLETVTAASLQSRPENNIKDGPAPQDPPTPPAPHI